MKKVILEKDPNGVQRITLIEAEELERQIPVKQEGLLTGVFTDFYRKHARIFRSIWAGICEISMIEVVTYLVVMGLLIYAWYYFLFVIIPPEIFH